MLKNLNFKKQGGMYVSDPIQLKSDAGLHLEFAHQPFAGDIRLLQSMTGSGFSCFWRDKAHPGDVCDMAITGVVPGMFVCVHSSKRPVVSQILVQE